MKKLLCILFVLTAWGHAVSSLAQVRMITRTNDVRQLPVSQDAIYWFQGETVQYDIYARNGRSAVVISNAAVPMWYVTDSTLTNYFVMNTGTVVSATNGHIRFTLAPTYSALTSKLYQSAAIVYFDNAANPSLQLVVDRTAADVRKSFSYAGTYRGPVFSTNGVLDGNTAVFPTFWTANATSVFAAISNLLPTSGGGTVDTNAVIALINASTNMAARLASNVWALAGSTTNYARRTGDTFTGGVTFNGAINANDNVEIANTKHLRFQDGGGTNTVHLAATAGRLIITGAVDIVTAQAVPATINGAQIATASDVSARLASNVWAAADSTTNFVRRTGDTMTGALNGKLYSNYMPVMRSAAGYSFSGSKRGDANLFSGIQVKPNPANGDSPIFTVATLSEDLASVVYGPMQEFAWVFDLDGGAAGDYWRLKFVGFDTVTQTVMRLYADYTAGASAKLYITNAIYAGDGAGITNLSAFASLATNGSGNVVTNLTFGGSVITQQMGTVSGGSGGAAAISNAFVHFNLGAARNATNNGMGLARGYLDTDTATNDIFPAFFVTVSSNVVQDAYAKAWVRWPVANPTQIQLRVWYQGNTNNPLEARFSNGTNAVAYVLGAASADALNTITLTPSGFLTSVVENAAVQLRISAAFASTSSVPMGRGIEEGIWVRR